MVNQVNQVPAQYYASGKISLSAVGDLYRVRVAANNKLPLWLSNLMQTDKTVFNHLFVQCVKNQWKIISIICYEKL